MTNYSEAELKLIGKISPYWLDIIAKGLITPNKLYDILALEIFVKDQKGPEVDAIRKILIATYNLTVVRNTPEFDKLCEF